MIIIFKNISIISIISILMSGCAATGSIFSLNDNIAPGESQIIFYRPIDIVGSAITLTIKENEKDILKIKNGQFVPYLTKSSINTYSSNSLVFGHNNQLKLELKSNETYYVRLAIRNTTFSTTVYLSRVYEEEALQELNDCCKSGK